MTIPGMTVRTILAAGGVERIEQFRAEHGPANAAEVALTWALDWDDTGRNREIVDLLLAMACCCEILGDEPVTEFHVSKIDGLARIAIAHKQHIINRILTTGSMNP